MSHKHLLDAHLPAELINEQVAENLSYFGLARAVVVAAGLGSFESERDTLRHLETHLTVASTKLASVGVGVRVAAGLSPELAPQRAAPALWAWLDGALRARDVQVIGPLGWIHGGFRERRLLVRQLELAAAHEVPVYLNARPRSNGAERELFELLDASRLETGAVRFVDVPLGRAREHFVLDRPCAVALPPTGLDPTSFAEFLEPTPRRAHGFVAGTQLGARSIDVAGMPRLDRALSEVCPEAAAQLQRSSDELWTSITKRDRAGDDVASTHEVLRSRAR